MEEVEPIAEKKVVSFLYIALGEAAIKTLLDRKSNIDLKATKLKHLLKKQRSILEEKQIDGPPQISKQNKKMTKASNNLGGP